MVFFYSVLGFALVCILSVLGIKDFFVSKENVKSTHFILIVLLLLVGLICGSVGGIMSVSLSQTLEYNQSLHTESRISEEIINKEFYKIIGSLFVGYISLFIYLYVRRSRETIENSRWDISGIGKK